MANRTPGSNASASASSRFSKTFRVLASAAAIGGLVGCMAPEDAVEEIEQPGLTFNGLTFNGLTFNGLTFNGLTFNGLTFNGLTFNGLTFNGAGSTEFADWFNNADGGDLALHDMTMKYVIRCAIADGRVASFTDKNGVVHSWAGGLGLADTWDQNPPTDEQKQWVSACLMAHVNSASPAPKTIQVSLRGAAPTLTSGTLEKGALTTFDGVFFGDLFTSPNKLYICNPTWTPPINYQTTLLADWGRQCFFSANGCAGVFTPVDCNTACTPSGTAEYEWGPSCTVDGVTYPAVNAYVPRFKMAKEWTRSGTLLVACAGCLDGKTLDNFSSSSYAQVNNWTSNIVSGNFTLDVRYNNATSAPLTLRVQVNGTAVMNGSNAEWDFPVTGSAWGTRSIPVYLPSGSATVKLMGPSKSKSKGPKVEVVSLRAGN